jgi:hypothetical protein
VDDEFETAYGKYFLVKKDNDQKYKQKVASLKSLIETAKTLDDVTDVIPLPSELLERLGKKSTALVALNPDTLKSLKRDFAIKKSA